MPTASFLHHRRRPGAIIITATIPFALLLGFSGVCASASAGQSAPAAPVSSGVRIIEETFVLKHLKPSSLVTFLTQGDKSGVPAKPGAPALLPTTIKSVTPDDVYNTVTVQGAPDAIAAIRKVASLLDVAPQPVRLTVRIIRYRSAAAQKAGGSGTAPLADVEEVASGVVETSTNVPVELTTYGDRHTFRARLIPHINNHTSVSVAADLQMANPDGTFTGFSGNFSGTRQLRVGDRGLITSVGSGISVAPTPISAAPADPEAVQGAEKTGPETYYLEVTPSFPSAAPGKASPPAKS